MKKTLQKVALMLHPHYAAILRAAKNVRAGKEDSLPLRMSWRFYMLSWQGNSDYGKARADERHAEIERLYSLFAEPKSNLRLYAAANFCIKQLYNAGKSGVIYVPTEEQRLYAKKNGLPLYDESQSVKESMEFLRLLKKAALNPFLYSAIYSKD